VAVLIKINTGQEMTFHLQTDHKQHMQMGVTFGILAALSLALMSLMTKLIGDQVSTSMVVFVRFSISLILILPSVIKHHKSVIRVANPLKLLFRSIFSLLSLTSFFYVLKFVPLTEGLLLTNTSTLFIPLILFALHQIHTSKKIWIGVVLGFIGIAFVLKPGADFFQPIDLVGLASGFFAAIVYISIRFLTKTNSILQILFYNFLICSIISGSFVLFNWKPFNLNVLFLLFAVGVFGAIYQFFNTLSIAKAPIRYTSSLQFLSIVFGVPADFFIWNTIPNRYSLIGIILVILGGIITIYFGQKELRTRV